MSVLVRHCLTKRSSRVFLWEVTYRCGCYFSWGAQWNGLEHELKQSQKTESRGRLWWEIILIRDACKIWISVFLKSSTATQNSTSKKLPIWYSFRRALWPAFGNLALIANQVIFRWRKKKDDWKVELIVGISDFPKRVQCLMMDVILRAGTI